MSLFFQEKEVSPTTEQILEEAVITREDTSVEAVEAVGAEEFTPTQTKTDTFVAVVERKDIHDEQQPQELAVETTTLQKPNVTEEILELSTATTTQQPYDETTNYREIPLEETVTIVETVSLTEEVTATDTTGIPLFSSDLDIIATLPAEETVVTTADVDIHKEEKPMEVTMTVVEDTVPAPVKAEEAFVTEEITELVVTSQTRVTDEAIVEVFPRQPEEITVDIEVRTVTEAAVDQKVPAETFEETVGTGVQDEFSTDEFLPTETSVRPLEDVEGPEEIVPDRRLVETLVASVERKEVHDERSTQELVTDQPVAEQPSELTVSGELVEATASGKLAEEAVRKDEWQPEQEKIVEVTAPEVVEVVIEQRKTEDVVEEQIRYV